MRTRPQHGVDDETGTFDTIEEERGIVITGDEHALDEVDALEPLPVELGIACGGRPSGQHHEL